MVACSTLKKSTCSDPSCQWIRRKGCKSICPIGSVLNPITNKCQKVNANGKKNESLSTIAIHHHLIDYGAYGCIITPPISQEHFLLDKYIEYNDQNVNDISKLFIKGKRTFENELKILIRMQKIDPYGIFTLKLKGANKINKESLKNSNSTISCLKGEKNNYFQIIMENGGVRAEYAPVMSYETFLKMFVQFLKGLLIMQGNDIVHCDIKPGNVLVLNNKLNLIDFGLSDNSDKIYISSKHFILHGEYKYYPPEFTIADFMIRHSKELDSNYSKFIEIIDNIEKIAFRLGIFSQSYVVNDDKLSENYHRGIKAFGEAIKMKGYTKVKQIFSSELAFKADVFSLAYIIAVLNKKINFTSDRQKRFVSYIYDRCINANPYDRISMFNLYNVLKKEIEHNKNNKTIVGGSDPVKESYLDSVSDTDNYATPQKY